MDDRKNLPDHETLTPLIHNSPKPDYGNLQKKSCFIRWVAGIDKIDDPHIGLGRVLAVQSARVLLQGPLPRHRHGQQQGIQRGMVEPFTVFAPTKI